MEDTLIDIKGRVGRWVVSVRQTAVKVGIGRYVGR